MEDHGAREAGQGGRRVGVGIARVDHDRQARRRRDLELAIEERALDGPRGEIVEVVEARLPDRDGLRVLEQLDELVDPGSPPGRPPGADRSRAPRTRPRSASAIASAARHDAMPVPIVTMRETPTARARSTRNAAGSSHPSRWAWVSITCGAGYAAGSSRRGKSGGAASIPSVSAVRP